MRPTVHQLGQRQYHLSCHPSRVKSWACLILLLTTPAPGEAAYSIVSRVATQEQGSWRIDYVVRSTVVNELGAGDVGVRVRGLVSNSRVASHGISRPLDVTTDSITGDGVAPVIPSEREDLRCVERVKIRAWADGDDEPGLEDVPHRVRISPNQPIRIRILLVHDHFLYGAYDPLLGIRRLDLRLGIETIRDEVSIDHEQYFACPRDFWETVPDEHKDTTRFVSSPDSLLLDASLPGCQYFRFPERKVRYGSVVTLSFSYWIARGTEGDFKVRVAQYRESPGAWQVLSKGAAENVLKGVGRWVKFEKSFVTESEATTMAVDFRIANAEIGEVWIDDLRLDHERLGRPNP
jgi:hypothetical protein